MAYLVFIAVNSFNASSEFVRNVQFVGIKQQNDSIDSFSEPLENSNEVIANQKISCNSLIFFPKYIQGVPSIIIIPIVYCIPLLLSLK